MLVGFFILFWRRRKPFLSFLLFWYFSHLAIESSVLDLELVFEHRLYLPSVAPILGLAVLGVRLPAKWWTVGCLTLVILLSTATYERNGIWRNEVTLWEDVVAKAPNKPRGHNNLGVAYKDMGRLEDAIREYQAAIQLQPTHANAHNNLGLAYQSKGMLQAAQREFEQALKIKPDFLPACQALEVLPR